MRDNTTTARRSTSPRTALRPEPRSARAASALLLAFAVGLAGCSRVDTGTIDLGRRLDVDRVEVEERTATFRAGEPLAFALFLTGAPGPTELTLVLLQPSAGDPTGAAVERWRSDVVISVRDFQRSRAGLELPDLTTGLEPGPYRLQVRRGDLVLAEGRFAIVPP